PCATRAEKKNGLHFCKPLNCLVAGTRKRTHLRKVKIAQAPRRAGRALEPGAQLGSVRFSGAFSVLAILLRSCGSRARIRPTGDTQQRRKSFSIAVTRRWAYYG